MINPQRVHILGGPGSGKSYLADHLSDRLQVPHIDLDSICWNEDFTQRIPSQARTQRLNEVIDESEGWIIEGAYCSSWLEPSFSSADTILHLDTDSRLQKMRLGRRLAKRILKGETDFKRSYDLICWVDGFNESLEKFPDEYKQKVIPLIGKTSVKSYLENPIRPDQI